MEPHLTDSEFDFENESDKPNGFSQNDYQSHNIENVFSHETQNVGHESFNSIGDSSTDIWSKHNHVDKSNAFESYLDTIANYDSELGLMDTAITDNDFIGNPLNDTMFWQPQTTEFTCAVQAQRGIIEVFTGNPVSEAELTYHATVNGWLTDKGMSPLDAGKLLEMYGVEVTTNWNSTVEDLLNDLAQGKRVIVGVNSDMLNGTDHLLSRFFNQAADHAIWVTGVDLNHTDGPSVIINDSGVQNGAGISYPLEHFISSWETSGFLTISTVNAPPSYTLSSGEFNSETQEINEMTSYLESHIEDFSVNNNHEVDTNTFIREVDNRTFVGYIEGLNSNQIDELFQSI
jgi:sulfur carrier protein ThiS